jgi:phage gp37-like protein
VSRRAEIEVAVLAALAPLSRVAGGYLAYLDQYNGELDGAKGSDDIKRALLGRAPSVLVTTSGALGETKGLRRRDSRVTLSVELVVISNHLRSMVAQNAGDGAVSPTADPGSYQILEDVRQRLHGHRLSDDPDAAPAPANLIGLLVWESDGVVIQAPDITAWRSAFSIRYWLEPLASDAPPITSIEEHFNLDQGGDANPAVVAELEVQS